MLLSRFLQWVLFISIIFTIQTDNQFYRAPPHDVSGLINSNITIPCVISSFHGDVQWTKDGLALGYKRELPGYPSWSIVGDETQGEFNLSIQSLKLDDEGIFACEVSPHEGAPALRQIANLQVFVPPEHVQINNDGKDIVSIPFDEKMHQIECQVDGAKPAANIRWIDESDQELPATSRNVSQDRLFTTISTLTLEPSLSLNKKRFTCEVQHVTFTDATHELRTSFEIQITSPPSAPVIRRHPSTDRLINGSYLTLSCQSSGGSPLGQVSWYRFNGDRLNSIDNSSTTFPEQNLVENNVSMIIKPSDNNRTFSCQVTNDYLHSIGKVLQTDITLQVAFGPTFVHIEGFQGNKTMLVEGTTRKFICRSSSSNPRAILTWKLDETIIPSDTDPLEKSGEHGGKIIQSTKTIGLNKSLREYHQKTLSCEARNPDTSDVVTDSTRLNIIFDAVNIEMHGLSKEKIIKVGQTLTVDCILHGGNPPGKITWYKGNDLFPSEDDTNGSSRVSFMASSLDNNLPLTCKGQVDNFPSKIASFVLNITFLPEKIEIIDYSFLSNLSLGDENFRVLECRTSPSNPQVQLTVFRQTKDGQKYLDIPYRTSSTYIDGINSIQFTLPKIDLSWHENQLICEALLDIESPPLTKQVIYLLYVNHKPYFSELNSSFDEVIEDQSLNITLTANAYPLPISYTWLHPTGRQLNRFVNESQLSLMKIQRTDLGVYRCLARNSLGTSEINFTLNVLYGPVITRTQGYPVNGALTPGSLATLLCAIDANPIDLNTVRWYKGDQEISSDQWEKHMEGKEVSIIRKLVHRDDTGVYTCQAENPYGRNQATIPLFVQYPPEINRTDNKVAVDSERSLPAEFHCHFSAIPQAKISWFKGSQLLSNSSKYQSLLTERPLLFFDAVLHVSNIIKSDYGVYQCKIENALGADTVEFHLSGLTIPDPPHDIQVVNISYSSALITWSPGFDGGAPQTFQIRHRLSTINPYFYANLPPNVHAFELRDLKLSSDYHLNIRANNSHHISPWSNEIILKTSDTFPTLSFHLAAYSPAKLSFTVIIIIGLFGLVIFLVNMILLTFFVIRRRRWNINGENLSIADTNETETNTGDLFQPMTSNFSIIDTSQKYDEEDMQKPFVSSVNVSQSEHTPETHDRFSRYDNLRLHQYQPIHFDHNLPTYRSFKVNVNPPSDLHESVRTDLV